MANTTLTINVDGINDRNELHKYVIGRFIQ